MAQAALRPAVRGPTFVRLLARLAEVDVAAPSQALPDRLGQWLDWNHALSLAAALDSHPAAPEGTAPAADDLIAECARARDTLLAAIGNEPLLAADAQVAGAPDFAPYRHACLTRQRAMQATAGRLRGRLRDALMAASPELARLAEVDAVMEVALTPREHTLLARVPDLLGQRFARLHAAAQSHWLATFRRDMHSVLLAELDLRFQPVDALLAALRTHQESTC